MSLGDSYFEFPVPSVVAREPFMEGGFLVEERLLDIDGVSINEDGSTNLLPVWYTYAPGNIYVATYYETSQSFPNGVVTTSHYSGGVTEFEGFVVSYGDHLDKKSYPMLKGYFDRDRIRIFSKEFELVCENDKISETPTMSRYSDGKWKHHG